MGWQDRDYAKPAGGHTPVYRVSGSNPLGGRSIVTTLIIINVGIHFAASLVPGLGSALYGYGAMQSGAVLHGQIWRLITAQYLHDPSGLMHLAFNMIGLHFLGRPLERMWSPRKFLTIYTISGVCGNLFFTLLGATGVLSSAAVGVGASGCILGLLGVVAVLFPNAKVLLFFFIPMKIRTAALLAGAMAYWTIVQRAENYGGEACHLGGLVFGAWWALKGDAWWSTTVRASLSKRANRLKKKRPTRRTSRPEGPKGSAFADKIAQRREDEETIDRILKKVYEKGVHSLADWEKQALQSATKRQKDREANTGRIDRL